MLSIALVGAGTMGRMHAGNFNRIDGCRVTNVYDEVTEAAEAAAAQLGAEAVTDPEGVLAEDVDIVAIACPTPAHADYCCMAAQAGKQIFCEKPLARSLEQGERIVNAVRETGVCMMVGHVVRFFPEYAAATTEVHSGALGKVGMVRTSRINTLPGGPGSWFRDYEMSGGVTLDMIVHDFDWLLWTFGQATTVCSRSLHQRLPRLDYSLTSVRFAGGAVAHVEGSWADVGTFRTSFEIAGSNGLIEHDSTGNSTLVVQRRASQDGPAATQVPSSPSRSPYLIEAEAFIDAVTNATPPPVTVEDAFAALELALAACRSAETGEIVKVGGDADAD